MNNNNMMGMGMMPQQQMSPYSGMYGTSPTGMMGGMSPSYTGGMGSYGMMPS